MSWPGSRTPRLISYKLKYQENNMTNQPQLTATLDNGRVFIVMTPHLMFWLNLLDGTCFSISTDKAIEVYERILKEKSSLKTSNENLPVGQSPADMAKRCKPLQDKHLR